MKDWIYHGTATGGIVATLAIDTTATLLWVACIGIIAKLTYRRPTEGIVSTPTADKIHRINEIQDNDNEDE